MFCILPGLNPDLLEEHQQPQAQEDQGPRLHTAHWSTCFPLSGLIPDLWNSTSNHRRNRTRARACHTLVCMFSLIWPARQVSWQSNHHSLAHQQGRLARRVHHCHHPPDRHLLVASIFDFRTLFQATDAVPCCCKRTTKSSVLSCHAASATATLMFVAFGLAPMVADPSASSGFAAS